MTNEMESLLNLKSIGVQLTDVDPDLFIGQRSNEGQRIWVVSTRAATANAFEIRGDAELAKVIQIAQVVMRWDCSVIEGSNLSWAEIDALEGSLTDMLDGPVKKMICEYFGKECSHV